MIKHSAGIEQEAVPIAPTSGLPRERVASDLGIGKARLDKRVSAREHEPLHLKNRILARSRTGCSSNIPRRISSTRSCWKRLDRHYAAPGGTLARYDLILHIFRVRR